MSFFGKNIRKIRSVKTLSQQAFAELFDLKRGTLGAYEEGRSEPKIETLIKIANYFSIPIGDLLTRELTVNELLKFKGELTEQFEAINKERFTAIPCITEKNSADYINYFDKNSFVADMVHVEVPIDIKTPLRAYIITNLEMSSQDQGLFPKDWVIGEFVPQDNYTKLSNGTLVLVLAMNQLILRRLYIVNDQFILRADHKSIDEITVAVSDVKEMWCITAVFQRRVSEVSSGIEEKLIMLEQEFAKLRGRL
ncbi:helix-turn-helix domain-containing protein [Leeuwenhoekiella sp. MAR_2009_132]|uniref:helix-turn-helix domain-containing protein n=1 Tax=Leeuwenhoekiella sp. MAR_2009_132 TaxID=1392489 RepID=UPI0004911B02|nr:helix-turn-helix transcriptional regulator [Leeuwenhoekiella sp. MAR_2009_132]